MTDKGKTHPADFSRRVVIGAGMTGVVMPLADVFGGGGLMRAAMAAVLAPTPRQTPGPFYPRTIPSDHDNDLVRVRGNARSAIGTVTHVFGRVLDPSARPVPGAIVEIWQCDANGRYRHPADRAGRAQDDGFQGYGRVLTDADGLYRFRTIRPVSYPGRTPHIHFVVRAPSTDPFTTQMYVEGEPLNATDIILNNVTDPDARARLIVPLVPAPDIEPDALSGTFHIILGSGGA